MPATTPIDAPRHWAYSRSRGRLREYAQCLGASIGVVAGILAVLFVLNPAAATRAYGVWWRGPASYGSPWFLPFIAGHPLPYPVATGLTVAGWLLAILLGAALALGAARRPTVAEVSLVMVAVVLLTGKAFTVQSSLWLVPLVALSALDWRDHLVWAGSELLHFVAVWLTIAGVSTPSRGMRLSWYAAFLCVRLAGVGWLAYRTWLGAYRRWPVVEGFGGVPDAVAGGDPAFAGEVHHEDEVHHVDEVDQCAGVMWGAPDQRIVRFG